MVGNSQNQDEGVINILLGTFKGVGLSVYNFLNRDTKSTYECCCKAYEDNKWLATIGSRLNAGD